MVATWFVGPENPLFNCAAAGRGGRAAPHPGVRLEQLDPDCPMGPQQDLVPADADDR